MDDSERARPGDPAQRNPLEEPIRRLLASQQLGVLATSLAGHPYTTLVAFAMHGVPERLLFATSVATRKFANLTAEPRASLLIDDRRHRDADFREATALTALGRVRRLTGDEGADAAQLYRRRFPFLREFLEAPSCALCLLEVERFIRVDRFQHVLEWDLTV